MTNGQTTTRIMNKKTLSSQDRLFSVQRRLRKQNGLIMAAIPAPRIQQSKQMEMANPISIGRRRIIAIARVICLHLDSSLTLSLNQQIATCIYFAVGRPEHPGQFTHISNAMDPNYSSKYSKISDRICKSYGYSLSFVR